MLVAQSCPTLCHSMDYSLPGSSVHEILQARILEWVDISFSGGSSQPRDRTRVSCVIASRLFTTWTTREVKVYFIVNRNMHILHWRSYSMNCTTEKKSLFRSQHSTYKWNTNQHTLSWHPYLYHMKKTQYFSKYFFSLSKCILCTHSCSWYSLCISVSQAHDRFLYTLYHL